MPWLSAGVLRIDADGRHIDADPVALDILGASSVEELLATPPDAFQPVPPDADEAEAFRAAFTEAAARGLIGEGAIRRLDGELVRVRTAILRETDGTYRALLYPIERPTENLTPRIYRIADVLAEWRSAERRLVQLDSASEEGRRVAAEVELLRQQYQVLFERSV
jgi:PAS domain-containing protein